MKTSKTEAHYRTIAPCVPSHQNVRGVDAADHFKSASSHTLGERIWSWIFRELVCKLQSFPLEDGNTTTTTIPSTPSSLSPLLTVSLASSPDSLRMFHEAWKHGNLDYAFVSVFSLDTAIILGSPCDYLFFLFFGTAYISRAHFQRYKVTHTQKFSETPDPAEVEGRWRGQCATRRLRSVRFSVHSLLVT